MNFFEGFNRHIKRIKQVIIGLTCAIVALIYTLTGNFSGGFLLKSSKSFLDPFATDHFTSTLNFEEKPCAPSNKTEGLFSWNHHVSSIYTCAEESNSFSIENFHMTLGAELRLGKETGLRFKATFPSKFISSEDCFGLVIAPKIYFEKAILLAETQESIDYIALLKKLEERGAQSALNLICLPTIDNDVATIQGSIIDILYENTNLDFCAIAYAKDVSGTYVYADYPVDYSSCARSISYIATAALNDPNAHYSDENKLTMKKIVNCGAHHLLNDDFSEEEMDYSISISSSKLQYYVGQSENFLATVTTDREEKSGVITANVLAVPVFWKSSDQSIFVVDAQGKVSFIAPGEATLYAMFAETCTELKLIVSAKTFYACSVENTTRYDVIDITSKEGVVSGEKYSVSLALKDTEYEAISFFMNNTPYTLSGDGLTIEFEVSAPTNFKIEHISTAWKYFSADSSLKYCSTSVVYPAKLILPIYNKSGNFYDTSIGASFFTSVNKVKLKEIYVPEYYEKWSLSNLFSVKNLVSIYLYNENLCQYINSNGHLYPNKKLKTYRIDGNNINIYVPNSKIKDYEENSYWHYNANIIGMNYVAEKY